MVNNWDESLYLTLRDVRKLGIKPKSSNDQDFGFEYDSVFESDDEDLFDIVTEVSRKIDIWCDQWFYSKNKNYKISLQEVNGLNEIIFNAPVIEIREVKFDLNKDHKLTLLEEKDYIVYDREEDKDNPRIVIQINTGKRMFVDLLSNYDRSDSFFYDNNKARYKNQRWYFLIDGNFGYLENGKTPKLIKKVTSYLLFKELEKKERLRTGDDIDAAFGGRRIRKEVTDGHSYELEPLQDSANMRGGVLLTGSHEIDQILYMYTRDRPVVLEVV